MKPVVARPFSGNARKSYLPFVRANNTEDDAAAYASAGTSALRGVRVPVVHAGRPDARPPPDLERKCRSLKRPLQGRRYGCMDQSDAPRRKRALLAAIARRLRQYYQALLDDSAESAHELIERAAQERQ
jgi:hypothetical protein